MPLVPPIALALHGGAGTFTRTTLSTVDEQLTYQALTVALAAGEAILKQGGTAREAVVATIVELENNALFNAGHGAVFTEDATHELDAGLMEGHTLRAGAVCGLSTVKNPIRLADSILTGSPHVFFAGVGAERYADQCPDIERVSNDFFSTPARLEQLRVAKEQALLAGPAGYFGTVGAVALDQFGHLAAGTSTGGLSNKRVGRVGDSPMLGAGVYASEKVAVSATGSGESFMRTLAAHAVDSRVRYLGQDIDHAAQEVIFGDLRTLGGVGGLIAIDRRGNITMPCNITSMARAALHADGSRHVRLFVE